MRFYYASPLRLFLCWAARSFRFIVVVLSCCLFSIMTHLFHFSFPFTACRLFYGWFVAIFRLIAVVWLSFAFLLVSWCFYNIIMCLFHILRLCLWISVKIHLKMKLFLQKIWIKLKKCIPLHPLSGTKYWSDKKEFFEEDYIKDREVVQWARFSLSRMRGARGKRTVRFARMWCQVLFEPRIRRSWTEQTTPCASVSSWTEAGAVRYYTM